MPSEAFGFTKALRLLNARDYQAVFDDAPIRASHQHLLILSRPNQLNCPRLGLVIAKKNIRLANQRNRIKRILRESFRLHQHALSGLDIIVLARRELDSLDNTQMRALVDKQWARLIKRRSQYTPSAEA